MPIEQYTYWSVTINNPDENDYLIIRNPNEKYIKSLVWTPEKGEEGTEHIQAWVRLQRNQTMAFVKKLYPRAHLKHVDKDMYNENTHQYAQKNDDTTQGNHEILVNDPLPAVDSILYKVLDTAWDRLVEADALLKDRLENHTAIHAEIYDPNLSLKRLDINWIERELIRERSGLEKIFISPTYEKMKNKYWREILFRLKYKQNAGPGTTEGIKKQVTFRDAECQTEDDESYYSSSCEESETSDESDDYGCSESDVESQDGD